MYKGEGCTDCYDENYYCDNSFDVGGVCGTDENGLGVRCVKATEIELISYRLAIDLTFPVDYSIIVLLWIRNCQARVAKALIMSIPLCVMCAIFVCV